MDAECSQWLACSAADEFSALARDLGIKFRYTHDHSSSPCRCGCGSYTSHPAIIPYPECADVNCSYARGIDLDGKGAGMAHIAGFFCRGSVTRFR